MTTYKCFWLAVTADATIQVQRKTIKIYCFVVVVVVVESLVFCFRNLFYFSLSNPFFDGIVITTDGQTGSSHGRLDGCPTRWTNERIDGRSTLHLVHSVFKCFMAFVKLRIGYLAFLMASLISFLISISNQFVLVRPTWIRSDSFQCDWIGLNWILLFVGLFL